MEYPTFFEQHLQGVIAAYNQARRTVTNGVGFIFITDVHIHLNGRASVPMIKEIGKFTDVKTVLCGGDHTWAFGSHAQCLADFEDSMRYMDPIREDMHLYHARGNHDVTIRSSMELETGYTMPYEQVQLLFASHTTPPNGTVEGKLYYYADDAESKTRYVILDTNEHHLPEDKPWGVCYGMQEAQLRWVCDTALRLPGEDWTVVVMGHVPCVPEISGSSKELKDLPYILEAFKQRRACAWGDFADAKGELVAYLSGHNHKDRSAVLGGVLHISTGCDAYCKDDVLPRAVGTTDNTLFDLFLVDKDWRFVRVFRIGAGSDRQFNY